MSGFVFSPWQVVCYLAVGFVVMAVILVMMMRAARNKYAMISIGLFLFIVGFVTYFSPFGGQRTEITGCLQNTNECSRAEATVTNKCECLCVCSSGAVQSDRRKAFFDECSFVQKSSLALSSVNRTLSAFYPSRGEYDDTPPPGWEGLKYWLFHLAAILYILTLAVSYFCIELINVASIWMQRVVRKTWFRVIVRQSELNVFWDVGQEAEVLAEQMSIKSIVFAISAGGRSWRKLQEDDTICKLVRKGVLWISSDSKTNRNLLSIARRHFFLSSDCHENVAKAQTYVRLLYDANIRHEVDVYVRVWADADDDSVFAWADKWNDKLAKKGLNTQINVLREETIVSRRFLIDHPMMYCPCVSEADSEMSIVADGFRILVIGFGVQGERLTGDMICDAQYPDGKGGNLPISVDVVDKDAATFGWWKSNCIEACTRYGVNFKNCVAGGDDFWKLLASRKMYDRIVICTQDDIVNLRLANDIANYYAKRYRVAHRILWKTIFARVRRPSLANILCDGSMDRYQLFGDMMDTYSPRWLLNDMWDNGAKFINGVWSATYDDDFKQIQKRYPDADALEWYQANKSRENKYWARISMFDKESSRASFLHMRNILRFMGYVCRLDRPSDESEYVWREIPESQKHELKCAARESHRREMLAESEHLRWMAFYFVRGWEKWSPTFDELEKLSDGGKKCVEPNSLKKLVHVHADLEDFANLDEVDEKFNVVNRKNDQSLVNSKNKDKNIVYGIEAIYAAGFHVFKKEKKRDV